MKMELAEIAQAVQAQNDISQWQDQEVTSVAFDSRNLKPGALFVPLQGQKTVINMLPKHLKMVR